MLMLYNGTFISTDSSSDSSSIGDVMLIVITCLGSIVAATVLAFVVYLVILSRRKTSSNMADGDERSEQEQMRQLRCV